MELEGGGSGVHQTEGVSFIRFVKSAIFVSRFRPSSIKLALSFCSLIISLLIPSQIGRVHTLLYVPLHASR